MEVRRPRRATHDYTTTRSFIAPNTLYPQLELAHSSADPAFLIKSNFEYLRIPLDIMWRSGVLAAPLLFHQTKYITKKSDLVLFLFPSTAYRHINLCDEPGAAMQPVFWFRNQAGGNRILMDVTRSSIKVFVVTYIAIEIITIPY